MASEDLWFRVASVIATGFFTGLFIANAFYWNKIRNGSCNAVTSNDATVLFWLNVIFAIIVGLLFLWALIRLFYTGSKEESAGYMMMSPMGEMVNAGGCCAQVSEPMVQKQIPISTQTGIITENRPVEFKTYASSAGPATSSEISFSRPVVSQTTTVRSVPTLQIPTQPIATSQIGISNLPNSTRLSLGSLG